MPCYGQMHLVLSDNELAYLPKVILFNDDAVLVQIQPLDTDLDVYIMVYYCTLHNEMHVRCQANWT